MSFQDHRFTGKLELCRHPVVKMHAATQMFVMVDYVRESTVKKPVSMANIV